MIELYDLIITGIWFIFMAGTWMEMFIWCLHWSVVLRLVYRKG